MEMKINFNESGLNILQDKAVEYLVQVANAIKVKARENAPVKTGTLRDSINVFDGKDRNEKYIGSISTRYALFVEKGTINMGPQAYLRPALDEVISKI